MTPLYDALRQYAGIKYSSFHTPGHKTNPAALPHSLLSLDFTELPSTDDLYKPTGSIKEAEALAAEYYGCASTLFCAGGCTIAVQTMLKVALRPGDSFILSRSVHKSVIHTMIALDLRPVWITESTGDAVRAAMQANPQAKAVLLTSPDYLGRLADISGIASVSDLPLLIDNAHGAHLNAFDLHPIGQGAAMCADSAHKTTPALTGGAFLHIADSRYSVQNAKAAMEFWGSSSPSFPILASLDLAREWLSTAGRDDYRRLAGRILDIREEAASLGLHPLSGSRIDPARFTLTDINGLKAAEIFRAHGVQPEFSDSRTAVFIPTPFNTERDFVRLRAGLHSCRRDCILPPAQPAQRKLPIMTMPPRQAAFSKSESVTVENAVGRISAQLICPCPPGNAILVPGEIIDELSVECKELRVVAEEVHP